MSVTTIDDAGSITLEVLEEMELVVTRTSTSATSPTLIVWTG
jgi:hypothetical protein